MNGAKYLYSYFENWLRRNAYLLVALREGYPDVLKYRKEFIKFASSSYDNMRAQSFEKLKNIVKHAYNTTSYYHTTMKRIGMHPEDIKEPKDLCYLSFVNKDVIEKNKETMISNRFPKHRLEKSYTGGTSGTHTSFFRDRKCTAMRIGRQLGILENCGYSLGDRCAFIWGVHAETSDSDCGFNLKRRFRKFAAAKETLCCTVMNEQIMKDFYDRLVEFKPTVFYGYPNATAQFADFIKRNNLAGFHVKTTICTAERLTAEQRLLLSEVFYGEVYNLYCTREHGCVGFECRKHNGFHIDAGSVHLEVVPNSKNPASDLNEIVITDLLNYGMPLIRNKIGDLGRLSTRMCECGSSLPLLESLNGRITDMLYRPDCSTVAGVMLVDLFMDVKEIKALQFVQNSIDEIDLFLEVTPFYNDTIEKEAFSEIRTYMGNEIKINIRIVPEIRRNPNSGKFQEVICKIKPLSTK